MTRWGVPLIAAVVAGVMSGCQSTGTGAAGSPGDITVSADGGPLDPDSGANVQVSVAQGDEKVAPDAPLKVTVTNGQLDSVTLTTADGAPVTGTQDGGTWVVDRTLTPKTSYQLTAIATGANGETTTVNRSFRTLTPRIDATYRVLPGAGTVGVGMPVQVRFDSAVKTPEQRAAVERAMKITVTPAQTGSWGWSSNTQLYWRPATFWKPGTKVVVNAPLAGVRTGDDKYVEADKSTSFTVGSARISTVNLKTHRMTVAENGKVVANYPISGGKPGAKTATRSGVKVITEKHDRLTMDAATLGVKEDDPDYYKIDVNWAMRVTDTGEFLHSAPWSVWAQGSRNVSHGCTNLGPRDAKAMYDATKLGDVVIFEGSPRTFKPGEGMDAWVYTWPQWQARSALAKPPAKPAAKPTTKPTTAAATSAAGTSTTATG